MKRRSIAPSVLLLAACFAGFLCVPSWAAITFVNNNNSARTRGEAHTTPRPAGTSTDVPLMSSICFRLAATGGDAVDPDQITVTITPGNGAPIPVLLAGQQFSPGFSGQFLPSGANLDVYIDRDSPALPLTIYAVTVYATSRDGAVLNPAGVSWSYTTESAPTTHTLAYTLPLADSPITWHGGFFTGIMKPSFCTTDAGGRLPANELMRKSAEGWPRAWSLQRDIWITGYDSRPFPLGWWWGGLPNAVRELETRRITSITEQSGQSILAVGDFFGHGQYGIPSGRPLSEDYHPGDVILVGDADHGEQATVVSVDDAAWTLTVTQVPTPPGGWKIDYLAELPTEDPAMPGLFPPGGCYLRKFAPVGTPHYYWGRIDKEYDDSVGEFGRRVVVNLLDAGDLSVDGRSFSTAKDYVQHHQVVHEITTHLIERYGDACLDFYWSMGNEPDLGAGFWNSGWIELQKYYDYTIDAVLRSFEDAGYDSNQVVVGGLELGAIFGPNLRLADFLSHCSPTAPAHSAETLALNAAYADPRLDGKRSARVEALCSGSGGKGSPLDFISIHTYNSAEMTATKLIRAKQDALAIDPVYYADLFINNHESAPDWSLPADPAFSESFLGNGFFSGWCADVVRRLLQKANEDPRYAYGESIMTVWMWVFANFTGANDVVQNVDVDDNGDGETDRTETVALPALHTLTFLNSMDNAYWVLPEQRVGGHVISGFAAKSARDDLRVFLYAHHPGDLESRSDMAFEVELQLDALTSIWPELAAASVPAIEITEFQFDRRNNSYFNLARQVRARENKTLSAAEFQQVTHAGVPHATGVTEVPVESGGGAKLNLALEGNGVNFVIIRPRTESPANGIGSGIWSAFH